MSLAILLGNDVTTTQAKTFLAEEVAAEYIIAYFAELCNKQFSSKNSCDAINDLPTL